METRELRYFIALAEELHFARAALRIGIEQSPLSKVISAMERRLGVQLFVRNRRSTALTFAGETLLKDARHILAGVADAHRNILAAATGCSGRLRVAICEGLAHPRMARLLERSRCDEPGIDIQIKHSAFEEQLSALQSGLVDVGFGMSASDNVELRSVPLWNDGVAIVTRPDHLLSMQQSVKKIDSSAGQFIMLGERRCADAEPIIVWLLSCFEGRKQIEFVARIELLYTLVAAGYGVGLISAAQAETIRRPDIIVRPVSIPGPGFTTFMLQRADDDSILVARFTERAQKMLRDSV